MDTDRSLTSVIGLRGRDYDRNIQLNRLLDVQPSAERWSALRGQKPCHLTVSHHTPTTDGVRNANAYGADWNEQANGNPCLVPILETCSYFGKLAFVEPCDLGTPLHQLLRTTRLSEVEALSLLLTLMPGIRPVAARGSLVLSLTPETLLVHEAQGQRQLRVRPDIDRPADLDPMQDGVPRGPLSLLPYRAPEMMELDPTLCTPGTAELSWSIGMAMVHMVTGRVPFEDIPPGARLKSIRGGALPDPSGLSAPFARLVMGTLRANPEERPSLAELEDEIRRTLDSLTQPPVEAPSAQTLDPDDLFLESSPDGDLNPAPWYQDSPRLEAAKEEHGGSLGLLPLIVASGLLGAGCVLLGELVLLLVLRTRGVGSLMIVP